jgi:hypothetical protein
VTGTGAQEEPRSGPNPKSRKPKAERNPKAETRTQRASCGRASNLVKPCSDFGFRPCFGLRVSGFGFQGGSSCSRHNRPNAIAALSSIICRPAMVLPGNSTFFLAFCAYS